MRTLSKPDFDARYPGERRSGVEAFPEGWYVIYRHEALEYYFGPARFLSTAEHTAAELRGIVEAARTARPGIEGYRIETAHLPRPHEESVESPPEERTGSEPPPPPPPPPSWLDRLLGIFRRS